MLKEHNNNGIRSGGLISMGITNSMNIWSFNILNLETPGDAVEMYIQADNVRQIDEIRTSKVWVHKKRQGKQLWWNNCPETGEYCYKRKGSSERLTKRKIKNILTFLTFKLKKKNSLISSTKKIINIVSVENSYIDCNYQNEPLKLKFR